jgi:perosamine synthetase
MREVAASRIPVAGPSITQLEIDYVTDAVSTAWYADANVYHARFERSFAEYIGTRFAVTLPSCTAGIHLALAALGIGPGDEVITPDITWIASVAPVAYLGATPVFADIDPETWCLSPASFEERISPRTKAVVPVDLYGGMADMDSIRAIAQTHGIAVIEDAAEAIGSEYRGQRAGSLGDVGVFSFHGSKTLTTGEGGMLVTNSRELHDRVLILRDHGRIPGDNMFRNNEIGYKYKMSSLQAALGLAQLERIDELIQCKRRVFEWYQERLGRVPGLTLNSEPASTKNSYWMVTVVIDSAHGVTKEAVMTKLSAAGIDTRPFFNPLSGLAPFAASEHARLGRTGNINSYAISPFGINLPSSLTISEESVDYVCRELLEVLASTGRAGPRSRNAN